MASDKQGEAKADGRTAAAVALIDEALAWCDNRTAAAIGRMGDGPEWDKQAERLEGLTLEVYQSAGAVQEVLRAYAGAGIQVAVPEDDVAEDWRTCERCGESHLGLPGQCGPCNAGGD